MNDERETEALGRVARPESRLPTLRTSRQEVVDRHGGTGKRNQFETIPPVREPAFRVVVGL